MFNKCVELKNVVTIGEGRVFGEVIKLRTLSFLGDVNKENGEIIAQDLEARGRKLGGSILVVNRFRGSTVGVYVLYSLCKRGLAPKAILMVEPDTVVISGIILCNIIGVINISRELYEIIPDKAKIMIECGNSLARLCIYEGSNANSENKAIL